jgi:hypothetical protein
MKEATEAAPAYNAKHDDQRLRTRSDRQPLLWSNLSRYFLGFRHLHGRCLHRLRTDNGNLRLGSHDTSFWLANISHC